MGWPRAFERVEVFLVGEGEAYVVEALHDALAGEVVHLEGLVDVGCCDGELVHFDRDNGLGIFPDGVQEFLDGLLWQIDGKKAVLGRVVPEDVGEGGCDHRFETVVFYGPDGVFAAGPRAEVLAGDQDDGIFVLFFCLLYTSPSPRDS